MLYNQANARLHRQGQKETVIIRHILAKGTIVENVMKDCFAYRQNGCTALKIRKCEGCSFYKTKEEYQLGRRLALERILSLDKDLQDHINKTYYGGKMGGGV